MKIDLSGKTAVVTGSTKGIGLAIAKGLAEAGARVVVNGRTEASVSEALGKLKAALPEGDVVGHASDVGTAEGCASLTTAYPACDILVNNAGIFGPQDFFETPDEVWEEFFAVDVMSGVRLSRHYMPAMERKDWGRVIFISSESGFNIPADMIHYGVMKTAYLSLSRGLAKRMSGTGVTVNAVLPGPTLSDGFAAMFEEAARERGMSLESIAAEFIAANRPASILRRATSTEEVANLVVYTCSPQASGTTGASLRVDGGVVDTI